MSTASTQASSARPRAQMSRAVTCGMASAAFLLTFAASGTPIPLYGHYRDAGLVTSSELSMTAVAYFAAAMLALLVLARLSNHLGRRPVAVATVLLVAVGSLILLRVTGIGTLVIARLCQGLACGLAPSALGAYVVDTTPERAGWLSAAVTGSGSMVGLTFGALLSGAVAEDPATTGLAYLIVAGLLMICAVLFLAAPETADRHPGALTSLRPQVRVPTAARALLPVMTAVAVATWALGGFYQAFSPLVAADQLGSSSTLVAAAIFSSYMAPALIGSPVAGRLSPLTAQRLGTLVFVIGLGGLLLAVHNASVGLFLAASVVAGLAQAVAYTGGLRGLLGTASPAERAGLLSAVYLISYGGAAVPGLIAGRLTHTVTMFDILIGYAALGVVACLMSWLWPKPLTIQDQPAGQDQPLGTTQ